MAYFSQQPRYQISPDEIIRPGLGVNTFDSPFDVQRGEAVSMLNMSNQYYPSISVRNGRDYDFASSSAPISKVNGAGAYSGTYLVTMDYLSLKYYKSSTQAPITLSSSLGNYEGRFLDFNTEAARYLLFVNSSQPKYWTGNTSDAIAGSTNMPYTKLYAVDDNRLYALDGSILKCSAEGSVTDWSSVYDADTIPIVSMIGTGTAITSYNGTIICWSDQTMHVLYGTKPLDFELSDVIENGCVGYKANIVHDGTLYFMDYYKIISYTGGIPVDVSEKVRGYLEDVNYTYKDKILMGSFREYIYVSIPYGTNAIGNNLTLQYDTKRKTWYVWNVGFVEFFKIAEDIYAVDSVGYIWKLNSGTDDGGTAITWSIEFGAWNSLPARPKKAISSIMAIVDLPTPSTMTAYYSESVDGDDWTSFYTFTASSDEQNTKMTIPVSKLQNIDWYRIKLAGTGPCTIHYLEPHLRVKAR